MKYLFFLTFLAVSLSTGRAQGITSYLVGDPADVIVRPTAGTCVMGGATEDDNAMRWFLERAHGGDILVIRATGDDAYNDYLYRQLGVTVNSVETIIVPSRAAASDPYLAQQLTNAEAIWIAGGDQYDYVSYWKGTPVERLLNEHVSQKHGVIGGTSAGMAILGSDYFSAAKGTVTSAEALADPFNSKVTLGVDDFLHLSFLGDTITDTHYDNPDRRGRHFTFIARLTHDLGRRFYGIACDEYTAICIDGEGRARAFGGYPTYDDNAYFLQTNCVVPYNPEVCTAGTPLTWDRAGAAVKVYHVKGDASGSAMFDLKGWHDGKGGAWEEWSAKAGVMTYKTHAAPPACGKQ
ncbi:MAG: cyanophycinase [Chthoniobacterales bacterium]|nr:cyanophycinase [Chthoniobacterales bacterium]